MTRTWLGARENIRQHVLTRLSSAGPSSDDGRLEGRLLPVYIPYQTL